MEDALTVEHLNKNFDHFSLNDITFSLPEGMVLGIIGENGSGKSTLIRCILGQDVPSSGAIRMYGINPAEDIRIHEKIGAAFDQCCFPEEFTVGQISKALKKLLPGWDEKIFEKTIAGTDIRMNSKIRTLSKGMKARVSLAAAISHDASLIVLDEATSGLDPVVREDMIDLLMKYLQEDPKRSMLMTSHITSDIEKAADLILMIQDGKIVFLIEKDVLAENYGLARLKSDQLNFLKPDLISRIREQEFFIEALITDRNEFIRRYPDYEISPASLDDVIVMYRKGHLYETEN